MSIPKQDPQATFLDTCFLIQDLFDDNDQYAIFRRVVLPALQDIREELCSLYCLDNGRRSIEPVLMAGVTLLQFMESVPDRQAAKNVRLHLGWKYALDQTIDYKGFHATSLVTFRERMTNHKEGRLIFDSILQALHAYGLVKRRGKQRVDSTHILGAVARMGRLEVVRETVRLFLLALQNADLHVDLDVWAAFSERYIDSEIVWHKANKETLNSKFHQAGQDMLLLLEWGKQSPELLEMKPYRLLQRVFNEQYEVTESGPKRRKHENSGVVKNPHDPDVQWANKSRDKSKGWEGYKAQIAETVPEGDASDRKKGEPTTGFVTEVTTTEAIASDYAGRDKVHKNQEAHGLGVPDEEYVDGGYISGETLADAEQEDRVLMGPARPSAKPSGNLFSAEQFDVSIANKQAVCPGGHISTQCSRLENKKTGQVDYRFEWSYHCDGCPLQSQCTNARSGRRMLVVSQHHDLLQNRRREMQTEAYEKAMYQRNGIEGTISEFVRSGGRRSRYRGFDKTSLCNYLQGAAINVKRWIRLLQYQVTESAVAVQ
jgi:transposase